MTLKPCPFCGGKEVEVRVATLTMEDTVMAQVECVGCGALGPDVALAITGTEREVIRALRDAARRTAIAVWNLRGGEVEEEVEIPALAPCTCGREPTLRSIDLTFWVECRHCGLRTAGVQVDKAAPAFRSLIKDAMRGAARQWNRHMEKGGMGS